MDGWHIVSALIAALAVGLIAMALVHLPRSPIAPLVYAFVGLGACWGVGDLLAELAPTMAWKRPALALLYTGSIFLAPCWWALAVRWAEQSDAGLPLRHPAWTWVPFGFAGLVWLSMMTNPLHGLFITPVVGGRNVYQPLWYVMAFPSYVMIVAALVVELAVVARVRQREVRRQGSFLIAASALTLFGNWLYVSGLVTTNHTQFLLAGSAALLVVGMAREGLFGVLPMALRDIAAEHPDGLVVVDPDGQIRFSNERACELFAPIEVSPRVPFHEVLRDPRLRTESASLMAWSEGVPWSLLTRAEGLLLRLEEPKPRWLHLHASPVSSALGRTRGHGVRVVDLTAHREGELQARQTRRLDSTADLARTISRQFQGTFALVQSNAELLLADSDGSPAVERRLGRIVEAARGGSDLALQLQLYTGSVSTQRVVLELTEVVREGCQLIESDLPPGVEVVLEPSDMLLPVHVDALQLHHCIFDLLSNAMEAMEETGGEIRVRTGRQRIDPSSMSLVWGKDQPAGEYAFVRVRDDGGGMEPETAERAFEPFFSTRGKDRGFGLPTVLGIARSHGAPVSLENDYGSGVEVTLYLPLEGRGQGS